MKLSYKLGGIALMMMGFVCQDAQAQLKESVDVEGKYNKEILYPDRLGHLPDRRRLTPPVSSLPYSFKGVAADFVPFGTPLAPTGYGAWRSGDYPRGYLSLSLGSWLNTELAAGYAVIARPDESLNVWLRHASTSLWKPFPDLTDNRRLSYQETIGADWSRLIKGTGRLSAGVRYHGGYFNYYGVAPFANSDTDGVLPPFPTQTLNDVSARIAFSDTGEADARNHWNSELSLRHFAFRTATRETELRLGGSYSRTLEYDPADFTKSSAIGFDAGFQWLFYGAAEGTQAPDGYGNFRLSPYYRLSRSKFSLRAGLNANFTFNADGVGDKEHYALFHISPDVRIDYAGTRLAAWVHATGGQQLQTLAFIADRNLYCYPALQSTTPVNIPVDLSAGIRVNPFTGFSLEGWFGYRLTRNVRGDGWTIPLMNARYGYAGYPFPAIGREDEIPAFGLGRARYNLSGIYAGLEARYQLGKILDMSARMEYAPQNATHGIYNGLDRPRWIVTPRLDVHPIEALTIGVSYEYRGVRSVWSAVTAVEEPTRGGGVSLSDGSEPQGNSGGGGGPSIGPGTQDPSVSEPSEGALHPVSLRLPDITRLNAHASYRFDKAGPFRNLTIGVTADNLLNHKETIQPGLKSEGLTVSGTISVLF